jgi:signal transduction histidine kinase
MSRLWWKIFFAFWGVIVATVVITVSINAVMSGDQLASTRFDRIRESLETLSGYAQQALTRDGEDGLREWLLDHEADQPFPPLLILTPGGRELLGRPVPRRLTLAGRDPGRLGQGPGRLGTSRGRQLPLRRLEGPDGRVYRLALPHFKPRLGGFFMRPEARKLFPIVLVLLSGLACLLLARYLTRPITVFRETGRRIAAGDLGARIGPGIVTRRDEFGALARDFDRMASRIEELLKSQQRLLRDVSHELRSPLARLQAAVGLIRQKHGDDVNPNLDRVDREAENLNALIGEVLQYSRLQNQTGVQRVYTDLSELLGRIVADACYEGQVDGRDVVFEPSEPVFAEIDEQLVHSAIENVIRNALQHSAGTTVVDLHCIEKPTPGARIVVTDDGPGIDAADLEHIFEPFFTTKPGNTAGGAGAGIGLAIARRAVELHGGSINARNGANGGVVVEIVLPL